LIKKELLNIFFDDFPKKIDLIIEALKTQQYRKISIICHSLKSNIEMLGIKNISNKFRNMEMVFKKNYLMNHIYKILKII